MKREHRGAQSRDPDAWRTRLCGEFEQYGNCSRGDACPFAHVAKEKRPPVANGPKRCFTWAKKGKCRKGDRCKYAHTYRGDGVYSAASRAMAASASSRAFLFMASHLRHFPVTGSNSHFFPHTSSWCFVA